MTWPPYRLSNPPKPESSRAAFLNRAVPVGPAEGWKFRMVASGIGATATFLGLSGHHMGLRQDSNLSVSSALIARLGRTWSHESQNRWNDSASLSRIPLMTVDHHRQGSGYWSAGELGVQRPGQMAGAESAVGEGAGASDPGLTALTLSGHKWAGLGLRPGRTVVAILAALARLLVPEDFGVLAIARRSSSPWCRSSGIDRTRSTH